MKYVIYLRVSTDKQDERPQLDHCLKYIRSKDKDDINYIVYQDVISSREKRKDRKGINEALNALKMNDILVAMRMDRLSRNLGEVCEMVEEINKKKAKIVLVDQPAIMLQNKAFLGMMAGMAEEEVKLTRKRVKEGLDAKKNRNERVSFETPYGYKLHPTEMVAVKKKDGEGWTMKLGKVVENEKEQEALKLMIEMSSQGLSYHKIGIKLEALGYVNRKGNQFQPMSICRILNRINPSKHKDQSLAESKFALFH